MAKIEISLLKSANGVQFASDGDAVHKVFGNNFKNNEKKKLTSADKDFMLKIAERMSKISGQPITDFTKYLDDDYDFDKDTSDYYSFCKIEYDENDKFNAIEIYSDQKTQLIVDGNKIRPIIFCNALKKFDFLFTTNNHKNTPIIYLIYDF